MMNAFDLYRAAATRKTGSADVDNDALPALGEAISFQATPYVFDDHPDLAKECFTGATLHVTSADPPVAKVAWAERWDFILTRAMNPATAVSGWRLTVTDDGGREGTTESSSLAYYADHLYDTRWVAYSGTTELHVATIYFGR